MPNKYNVEKLLDVLQNHDHPNCDCQIDLLDGEAIITMSGVVCFSHTIFLNDICIECKEPLQEQLSSGRGCPPVNRM